MDEANSGGYRSYRRLGSPSMEEVSRAYEPVVGAGRSQSNMDQQGSVSRAKAIARRIWKGPKSAALIESHGSFCVTACPQGRPWSEASMLTSEAKRFGELERLSSPSGQ